MLRPVCKDSSAGRPTKFSQLTHLLTKPALYGQFLFGVCGGTGGPYSVCDVAASSIGPVPGPIEEAALCGGEPPLP